VLTQPRKTSARLRQVADGCLFAFALLVAYVVRARFPWFDLSPLESIGGYLWIAPLAAVLGPVVLASQGFYDPPRPTTRLAALFVIVRSCAFTVVGLILAMFIVREQLARSVIILVGAIGGILVYLRHEISQWGDARALAQGQLRRRALWVGAEAANRRLRDSLGGAERASIEDAGNFDPATDPEDRLVRLLHEQAVNVVILNLADVEREAAGKVLAACAREGVEVVVRPGLFTLASSRLTVDQFAGEAVFYYRAQSAPPALLAIKQLMDYAGAAFLLVVLSPLLALLALAVRLTSAGPALYRQNRAGLNGRPFTMLKFRSMTLGAERVQPSLAERNEMQGPVFKVSDDPRVTPIGRFLRRHSFDELPQLWNVLQGEMSLVGPRPLPVEEVSRIDDDTHRRRLSVKPGMTCLWQISGRNEISDFRDWVRLDLAYIDNWSLWLDIKILLATVPVAIFGRGGR